jgi:hypothetical protein
MVQTIPNNWLPNSKKVAISNPGTAKPHKRRKHTDETMDNNADRAVHWFVIGNRNTDDISPNESCSRTHDYPIFNTPTYTTTFAIIAIRNKNYVTDPPIM